AHGLLTDVAIPMKAHKAKQCRAGQWIGNQRSDFGWLQFVPGIRNPPAPGPTDGAAQMQKIRRWKRVKNPMNCPTRRSSHFFRSGQGQVKREMALERKRGGG